MSAQASDFVLTPAGVGAVPARPEVAGLALPRRVVAGSRRLLRRAVIGLALALLALAGGLYAVRGVYADRVFPAVVVGDVNIGGLGRDEARRALQSTAQTVVQRPVTLTYAGKTWTPTLAQLGVTVNVDESLRAAYEVGREADAWDRLVATAGLARHDRRLPLLVSLDQVALARWIEGVNRDLGIPPHDASLTINGTTVTVAPEVDGTIVDLPAMTRLVHDAILRPSPTARPLPVVARVAKVRAGDMLRAQQQVQQALSAPLKVTFEGQSWDLAPADLGRFVTIQVDPAKAGADAVTIGVDEKALAAWLDQTLGPRVERKPVDAIVAWSDDVHGLISRQSSVNGAKLKPNTLAKLVAQSLLGGHAPVAIPVTVLKPDIDSTNLGALGITTRMGVGSSNYVGSNYDRATNVEVGARLLNGTLVPPHGEFSFNHAIGVITPDEGFVEAPVIDGERIGRDVGGGICQVSTTVFRAALKAGLPFTEWHPHKFRIEFYERDGWGAGYDASILQPDGNPFGGGDLRFQNPTDSWILVESYTQDERVYVILYGPDLGYTVQLSDPEISPSGLTTDATRVVTDRTGAVVRQDTWHTDFIGLD